jgi:hypothetical protein
MHEVRQAADFGKKPGVSSEFPVATEKVVTVAKAENRFYL